MSGICMALLGLTRLRMDPDILGMLPPDMPEVMGLRAFHEGFSNPNELILLIRRKQGAEAAAGDLAASLASAGLARQSHWRPEWQDAGPEMAELVAYLWMNAPPAEVRRLVEHLDSDPLPHAINAPDTAAKNAGSAVVETIRAHDPFGLLRNPALAVLMDSADGRGGGFGNKNGSAHLLRIEAPGPLPGYRDSKRWLEEVRSAADAWARESGQETRVSITGEPAFAAEIGGAMERDMRRTSMLATVLILIMGWVMQRRLALMGGMGMMVTLVFLVTLGLGGWIYGELSIMAAGFAAILIGLVVDYGVVISQEAKHAGGDASVVRRATRAPVIWAALTTAAVFFALNLSGLPGLAQLGTLVGIGMIVGAILMLAMFLPFAAKACVKRDPGQRGGGPLPSRKLGRRLTVILALAALAVLGFRGMPGISFDPALIHPRDSKAAKVLEDIATEFPDWGINGWRMVAKAESDAGMLAKITEIRRRFDHSPELGDARLPLGWWPDEAAQGQNREALGKLAARSAELLDAADSAGYGTAALLVNRAIFRQLEGMAKSEVLVLPRHENAKRVMNLFLSRNPSGGGTWAGLVVPRQAQEMPALETIRRFSGDGYWLSGWELLKPAVEPLISRDIFQVFLPMAGLMVVMLFVIFRRPADALPCMAAMGLSGVLLLAMMSILKLDWNFLNIAAAPLLLGTGIDYTIHMTHAFHREQGDRRMLWHGTGKAVLFCGLSTAAGFGSLVMASNEGMASLGIVAVIGIFSTMLICLFLLPAWLREKPAGT